MSKPLHLIAVLLAALGVAPTLRAADPLPPENTAPVPPSDPQGPFDIAWRTPDVSSRHLFHNRVIFSGDGRRLLVAQQGQAQVWDAATWKPVGAKIEYGDQMGMVDFDAAGKRVLAVREFYKDKAGKKSIRDAESRVWDVQSGKPVGPPIPHDVTKDNIMTAWYAVLSPDGQTVATAADGQAVKLWRADTAEVRATLPHKQYVDVMWFAPDGSVVSVDTRDGLRVWESSTGAVRSDSLVDSFIAKDFANGRVLVRVISGFKLFDAASGKLLLAAEDYYKYDIDEMRLSPSGTRVAIEESKYLEATKTHVWNVETGKRISTITANGALAFDPQGSMLVMRSWRQREGFTSGIWDTETGKQIRDLGDYIGDATFSPDGNLLALITEQGVRVIRADPTKKGAERWKVEKK